MSGADQAVDSIQGMDGSRNQGEKGCTGLRCQLRFQGMVLGVKVACQQDAARPWEWAIYDGLSLWQACRGVSVREKGLSPMPQLRWEAWDWL